jgi:tetratricopeptide (TPR) repeat protein
MREFIYNKLSPSKSRLLHNRAGEALEQIMSESGMISSKKLIYHYTLADNQQKVLYHKILRIEKFSGISYELYPIFEIETDEDGMPTDEIMECFKQLEVNLYKSRNIKIFPAFNELEARLLHAKSRYCILTGYYDEGLKCINSALENTFVIDNIDFRLKLLRQMIYYSIQICDTERMYSCIKEGISLAEKNKNQIENAIYLRLRGLFYIMTGEYRQAIASLLKSIDLFEKSNLNTQIYALNIAAAYNYLGELHLRQKHLKDAIKYYKKAISTCRENNCQVNPTFFSNIGKAYFFLNEYEKSFENLTIACDIYHNTSALVGKTVAEAFLAFLEYKNGNVKLASEHLMSAENCIGILKSPYEMGIFRYIQYLIVINFGNITEELIETSDFYLNECRRLLESFKDESILGSI